MNTLNSSELESLLAPLLDQEGVDLVDIEWFPQGPKWILRVFLDKTGGITLDDCSYFSERIGSLIDVKNAISHPYVLEVSSPGLDRKIRKEKDFERFAGHPVSVKLRTAQNGQKNFRGILKGLSEGKVVIALGPQTLSFDGSAVAEVRLDYSAEAAEESERGSN